MTSDAEPASTSDRVPRTRWWTRASPLPSFPGIGELLGVLWPTLLMAAALLSILALAFPALNSGDETGHMDYALQVWHGRLPVFEDGVIFRPDRGQIPRVQQEAQHPPLFYLLLAPIVGPMIDAGHPYGAVLVGRSINVIITVAALLAIGWAVSRIVAGPRPLLWARVATTFAAVISPVLRTGSTVYNDMLVLLLGALALGVAATALRRGVTPWLLVSAGLLVAGAMATRSNSIVLMVVVAGALAAGVLIDAAPPAAHRWGRAAAAAAVPIVASAVTAGWAYWRNITLSGDWTGSKIEWFIQNMNRRTVPALDVIGDVRHWMLNPWFLMMRGEPYVTVNNLARSVAEVLIVGGVIAMVLLLMRRRRRSGRAFLPSDVLLWGVMVAQFAGTLAMFVVYVMGGGGANARYFLPALIPVVICFAATIVVLPPPWRRVTLGAVLLAAVVPLVHWFLRVQRPHGWSWGDRTANDVPMAVIWPLIALAAIGLVLTVLRRDVDPADGPRIAAPPSGDGAHGSPPADRHSGVR